MADDMFFRAKREENESLSQARLERRGKGWRKNASQVKCGVFRLRVPASLSVYVCSSRTDKGHPPSELHNSAPTHERSKRPEG